MLRMCYIMDATLLLHNRMCLFFAPTVTEESKSFWGTPPWKKCILGRWTRPVAGALEAVVVVEVNTAL